jgi:hypothetical protein
MHNFLSRLISAPFEASWLQLDFYDLSIFFGGRGGGASKIPKKRKNAHYWCPQCRATERGPEEQQKVPNKDLCCRSMLPRSIAVITSFRGDVAERRKKRRCCSRRCCLPRAKRGCQIFRGTIYQNGENVPNVHKLCIPKCHTIYQMANKLANLAKWPKYIPTRIFHCKNLQNLSKLGFFGFENMPSGNPGAQYSPERPEP